MSKCKDCGKEVGEHLEGEARVCSACKDERYLEMEDEIEQLQAIVKSHSGMLEEFGVDVLDTTPPSYGMNLDRMFFLSTSLRDEGQEFSEAEKEMGRRIATTAISAALKVSERAAAKYIPNSQNLSESWFILARRVYAAMFDRYASVIRNEAT